MHIEAIRKTADFEQLEPEWNQLLPQSASDVPFLRHEYLRAWWQSLGGGEWLQGELYVVTARQEDRRLAGIAPFFFTQNRDGEAALMLLGSIEISDYLDLIIRREETLAFTKNLLAHLDEQHSPPWRLLDLYNILEDSPTLPALRSAVEELGWVYRQETLQAAPFVPLPGDWDSYLLGLDKKQRHEVRRKMRRLERLGNPARWYVAADEQTLEVEIEAFFDLMAQDPEKKAFLTAPMRAHMQATMQSAYKAGWLQLAFLEIGGEKAAGYFNLDYGNHVWVYNSGIDNRFRDLSPGWVLLSYLLRWANEQKRDAFDFMRGEEDYKYRFGGVNRNVVRVCVRR